MDVIERMDLLDKNTHLGFGLYGRDILCELLDMGEASVWKNNNFIPYIFKEIHVVMSDFSGSSFIEYTTEKGEQLWKCSTEIHYHGR